MIAALIGTKQESMLLPNARVLGAVKLKVLLIFNSIHSQWRQMR